MNEKLEFGIGDWKSYPPNQAGKEQQRGPTTGNRELLRAGMFRQGILGEQQSLHCSGLNVCFSSLRSGAKKDGEGQLLKCRCPS